MRLAILREKREVGYHSVGEWRGEAREEEVEEEEGSGGLQRNGRVANFRGQPINQQQPSTKDTFVLSPPT